MSHSIRTFKYSSLMCSFTVMSFDTAHVQYWHFFGWRRIWSMQRRLFIRISSISSAVYLKLKEGHRSSVKSLPGPEVLVVSHCIGTWRDILNQSLWRVGIQASFHFPPLMSCSQICMLCFDYLQSSTSRLQLAPGCYLSCMRKSSHHTSELLSTHHPRRNRKNVHPVSQPHLRNSSLVQQIPMSLISFNFKTPTSLMIPSMMLSRCRISSLCRVLLELVCQWRVWATAGAA